MRLLNCILLATLCFTSVSEAKDGPFALGVIVGTHNGLSAKYNLSEDRAIDAAIANSFNNDYGTSLHVDYLFDRARVFNMGRNTTVNFYYGAGIRAESVKRGSDDGKTQFGVRIPFGLQRSISNPNLDFFGELAPVLEVSPRSTVVIDAGLGLRYRF